MGLRRHILREFVEGWITEITDLTERARRLRAKLKEHDLAGARRLLPPERVYPLPGAIARRIGATG